MRNEGFDIYSVRTRPKVLAIHLELLQYPILRDEIQRRMREELFRRGIIDKISLDKEINDIATMPLEEQSDAWGELDERIMTDYFPIIPTAYRNDLFVFGEKIGNPTGDGALGAPNYKDLFVMQ